MGYEFLLFDVDNTILDFYANERNSIKTLFERKGVDFEKVFPVYCEINHSMWTAYEDGGKDMQELLDTRFSITMEKFGMQVDGRQWGIEYQALLAEGAETVPHANEVVEKLSKTHKLYIVTNGVRNTQLNRLRKAGMLDYFIKVYDSESIGYQKPQKEFFDFVEGDIPNFVKEKALVIGDSCSTDIKGGIAAGIDTCRLGPDYDKERAPQAKFFIEDLRELYTIV